MKDDTKNLNLFTLEDRKVFIDKIITYFLDERDEKTAVVAAIGILSLLNRKLLPQSIVGISKT